MRVDELIARELCENLTDILGDPSRYVLFENFSRKEWFTRINITLQAGNILSIMLLLNVKAKSFVHRSFDFLSHCDSETCHDCFSE